MKIKHRWSIGHNYLAGISFGDWRRLLRSNRFDVDWFYAHRTVFITALSFLNSIFRRREERHFQSKVEQTCVSDAPVFILGHWRSGTTHLHNLLALDQRFAYANTYQVVNPHTFLTTEETNTRRFGFLLPNKRPMDNMRLSFQSPQEDEFALLLSCFRSLYLGITFPRREEHYARYLTFVDVSAADVAQWKSSLLWFVKKLTFKCQRQLVLKSPPHTARIGMILDVFPGAKFIHIHRNPFRVFRSTQHYFDTAIWHSYLQKPDRSRINQAILNRYKSLDSAYFQQQSMVPAGQLWEMSFEDLEQDPIGQLEQAYQQLNLGEFNSVRASVEMYLQSLRGYQKNMFEELTPEEHQLLSREWGESIDRWRYAK